MVERVKNNDGSINSEIEAIKKTSELQENFDAKIHKKREEFRKKEEKLASDIENRLEVIRQQSLLAEHEQIEENHRLRRELYDLEIAAESTWKDENWVRDQQNIQRLAAIKVEKEKETQNALAAIQNATNKKLLEDQEFQAEHKANLLKEFENTLDAEENKHRQDLMDHQALIESGLYMEAEIKRAQWAEENAATEKLNNLRKKYAEELAKKNKTLSKEEEKEAEKRLKKQMESEKKADEQRKRREEAKAAARGVSDALNPDADLTSEERMAKLKAGFTDKSGQFDLQKTFDTISASLRELLDKQIETIVSYKGTIDTRLQGTAVSGKGLAELILTGGVLGSTSHWDNISKQITGAAGISPFVKQEDIANNVKTLVQEGINTNVAQRAFLQTIKSKVADTFDVTNGVLLRLVRIQQQDSTAARLGMESMITQFLNNMYENTEYLKTVSTSVKSSLEDAMALMSSESAISFEYQVQKWLGSYYSVGVSQNAVQSIADTLGKISSGKIEGVTGGGTGNLLVMAANQAGLSVADLLAKGLDESSTNQIMQAMSGYLYELLQDSSDNLVVQQQLANVYGMSAADLKAIANLYTDNEKTITNISKSTANYQESMNRLVTMVNSMWQRTGVGEMMTNAFQNLQYTISAGIANNPVLYATHKIAELLEDTVGGIDLPFVNVMGFGIDLNTSVAQLMEVGAMAGSLLSGIGQMITTGGGGGVTPSLLLNGFGINTNSGMTAVSRGSGIGGRGMTVSGSSTSESGYAGNSSGSDVKQKTLDDAAADSETQMTEAKDENEEATTTMINNNIIEILNIFKDVIDGATALHVKVDDYGLTNTGWN